MSSRMHRRLHATKSSYVQAPLASVPGCGKKVSLHSQSITPEIGTGGTTEGLLRSWRAAVQNGVQGKREAIAAALEEQGSLRAKSR